MASEVKVISEPMECNVTPVDSPSHTKSNNSLDVPMIDNSTSIDSQVRISWNNFYINLNTKFIFQKIEIIL